MDVQTLFQRLEKKHTAILSTAVATVTLAWYIKRVIRKSKEFKNPGSKEIPTPKGEYFYLGHLPLFKKLPAVQVSEWHKELGPIFRIKMGVQHWVFIGDPEAAHDILMTQGSLTSGRPFVTYGTKHHGEGNSKLWKKTRNATHSVLSPKMVDSLHDIVSRETEYGVQLMLKDAMKTTEGINPLAYTRLTALNIILATVYGIPGAPDVHDPFYNRVLKNLEKNAELISIGSDISAYFPILSFLDVIFRKEAKMKRFVKEESRPLFGN
ncbi:hypothetical protein G6F56_011071 [Rhizopus delemar]|nr:hypothetical protein G6F56_011071 [Rhizopus delemar]